MASHACLKNEFTEDEKCHNLMRWLIMYTNLCCMSLLTRGPLVLYRSPECIGHAEQAWKYMTICWINFHPCRSIRKQIWPCHKNGHGQPSVIIWTNLVVLEYLMLYTKFQGHQSLGSEEGDLWQFLPYMGLEASLVMWPGTFEQIFIPTSHGGSIWNLASNYQVFFLGKEILKCWI